MRAMAAETFGPPGCIRQVDLPLPRPRRGEVRVAVRASAVNPADLKVLQGKGRMLHATTFPLVAGYDFAGVIDEVGSAVSEWRPGHRVFGHLHYSPRTRQGAFAEHVAVAQDMIAQSPKGVEDGQLAAAATPGLTALQALRDHGRLQAGGRVLIIGASGGVGSLAIGVAKRLGAQVVAVCSAAATEFVRSLGADEAVARNAGNPASLGPYDVVFDTPAVGSYSAYRASLTDQGTYVTTLPSLDWAVGKVRASLSRQRCKLVVVRPRRPDLELLGQWVAEGMTIPIDSRFPVRSLGDALERVSRGGMRGRVVLDLLEGFAQEGSSSSRHT